MRKPDAAVPIVLIAVGVIWLLWNLDWFPDLRTIAGWTLIAAGIALLLIDGITRKSIVAGPFLILLGLLWFAHIEWHHPYRVLAPVALIGLGALMLLSRMPFIPDGAGRSDDAPRPPAESDGRRLPDGAHRDGSPR
jgi:hypothetical protein